MSDLTSATENEFAFLAELGLPIVERREFAPESYRGKGTLISVTAPKSRQLLRRVERSLKTAACDFSASSRQNRANF